MTRRRFAACLAAVVVAAASADAVGRMASSADGCGAKKTSADLLCRRYGNVTETAPSSAGAVAVARGPVKVVPGSTVHVSAHSLATMTFARQAQCAFGVVGRETEIVTRFGGDPESELSLYWQRLGNARCTFSGRVRPQTFFCELSVECPVVVTTSGRTQEAARVGPPARTSRVAHATEAETVTPVTLDFCTGRFRVDVSDEFGGASVGGGGGHRLSHVRVIVKKIDTVTQTDSTTVEDHEITLEAYSVSGPGVCGAD